MTSRRRLSSLLLSRPSQWARNRRHRPDWPAHERGAAAASPLETGLRSSAVPSEVQVLPANQAYDFEHAARQMANPELLEHAVALAAYRAPLVAIPVGEGRQGGCLTVDHPSIGEAFLTALSGRPGFPDLRLRTTAKGKAVLQWGAEPPSGNDPVASAWFYGTIVPPTSETTDRAYSGEVDDVRVACRTPLRLPAPPSVSDHDVAVLEAMTAGASERQLHDQGLYATLAETRRGVAALGRALSGGPPVRWANIVHRAVALRLVVPQTKVPGITLPEWQLDLLRAWARGLSLTTYGEVAGLEPDAERELDVMVRLALGGVSDDHQAVAAGHRAGVLTPDDPLIVKFGLFKDDHMSPRTRDRPLMS